VPNHDRDRFVIAPHHPDRLRRPVSPLGAAGDDRFRQALLWNTFRSLELVSPWFWLRRFHLRLTGEPALVPAQSLRVRLWEPLALPPVQRLDGERPPVVADVVIETEHAVWTLVAESSRQGPADSAAAAALVDAGRWYAGAREHSCGVIEAAAADVSLGSLLRVRYGRSRESTRLQSSTRGAATPARAAWGGIRYPQLAAILQECADAAILPSIERAVARHAADWLAAAGVEPPPS
jgi:hypothetical protein